MHHPCRFDASLGLVSEGSEVSMMNVDVRKEFVQNGPTVDIFLLYIGLSIPIDPIELTDHSFMM